MTLTIQIQQQRFLLHASGAIFWKDKNMLLISDVHLGKVAHFRKHGIAIPNETIFENFIRLTKVVNFFKPQSIVFLGDLFHSKINKEWDLFSSWTQSISAKIFLIEGNHDIVAKYKYTDLQIEIFKEWVVDGFLLTHYPEERQGVYNFCGHIHPGIKLKGSGKQSLKLPCFFQSEKQLILPAFGEFTGNFYLTPKGNDNVYAITKDEVILVAGS
ncbi:MAG: ligase-associated DNA damage response endonuclease PdeM [Burkholderiales bacterium]|nr:ligase-associated DNA damage response endonuclease PdeM [Flavobacterium sp.]